MVYVKTVNENFALFSRDAEFLKYSKSMLMK